MSTTGCICGSPAAINAGNKGCTIEMKPMAFPIFRYRYKADGTRNSIDVTSATLGADIVAMVAASTAILERLMPTLRVQNPTVPRTDTVYETTANGDKFLLDGEGGVYSFLMEYYGPDGVFQILREFKKMGCTDIDMHIATVDGGFWGTKDNVDATVLHGYMLSKETIDSFFQFPVPGARAKTMLSFDVDRAECIENSYVITADEMTTTGGVKSTDLAALVSVYQNITSPTPLNTTIKTVVYEGFGTANVRKPVTGLAPGGVATAFAVYDVTAAAAIVPSGAVETPDGTYVITVPAMTATNVIQVTVTASGYDVEVDTTIAS